MTQPDGFLPETAYNYDSLANLAARDEASWNAFIQTQALAGHTELLNEMYDGLPQNQGINLQSVFIQQMFQRLFNCNPGGTDLVTTLDNSQTSIADSFGGLSGDPGAPFGVNLMQTLFGFYCGCNPTGTTVAETQASVHANAEALTGTTLPTDAPLGVGMVRAVVERYTGFTLPGTTMPDVFDNADGWTASGDRIMGFVGTIIDDLRSVIDSFVNGLGGHSDWFGSGFTFGDALDTSYNQAKVLADVNAWVIAQREAANNNSGNGVYQLVDFATYPNQSNVPNPPFITYLTGGGSGQYGVVDGKLRFTGAGARSSFSFHQTPTDTTYQRIGAIFLTAPRGGAFDDAGNGIILRCNAAQTNFGLLFMDKNECELWLYSGTAGVWASKTLIGSMSGFRFKAGAAYWVETAGTSNVYKVFENTTQVGTITDTGNLLGTDSNYRYTGLYGSHIVDFFTELAPGDIRAFVLSDNQPPTYPGTGATMVRTSTGNVNISSGTNQLPASFWDAAQDVSADIAYNLTNGTFTVTRSGRYTVELRYKINTISAGDFSPVLYRDTGTGPQPYRVGGDAQGNLLADVAPRSGAVFVNVTLSAGDVISGGYIASSGTSSALTGEANGITTVFSIALTTQPTAFAA